MGSVLLILKEEDTPANTSGAVETSTVTLAVVPSPLSVRNQCKTLLRAIFFLYFGIGQIAAIMRSDEVSKYTLPSACIHPSETR